MAWADFWTALAQSYDGNKINPFAFARAFSPAYRSMLGEQRGLAEQEARTGRITSKGAENQETEIQRRGMASPGGMPIMSMSALPGAQMYENMKLRPAQQAAIEAGTEATRIGVDATRAGTEATRSGTRRADEFWKWRTSPFVGPQNTPLGMEFQDVTAQNQAALQAQQFATEANRQNQAWTESNREIMRKSPGTTQPDHFPNLQTMAAYWPFMEPQMQQKWRDRLAAMQGLVDMSLYNLPLQDQIRQSLAERAGVTLAPPPRDEFNERLRATGVAIPGLAPGVPSPAPAAAPPSDKPLPGAGTAAPAGKPNFGYSGPPHYEPAGMAPATPSFFGRPDPGSVERSVAPIVDPIVDFFRSMSFETRDRPPTFFSPSGYQAGPAEAPLPWLQTDVPPGQRGPNARITPPNIFAEPQGGFRPINPSPTSEDVQRYGFPVPQAPQAPPAYKPQAPNAGTEMDRMRRMKQEREQERKGEGSQFPSLLPPQQFPEGMAPQTNALELMSLDDLRAMIAMLMQQQGLA